MCVDPVTALVIAGGVTSAVGSLQSASATSSADKAQAAQARAQAQQVANKTSFDIDAARRSFQKTEGVAQNNIGNSGIAPASFASVLDDAAKQSALEIGAIRQSGDANRESLKASAKNFDAQAKSAKTAGYINAIGGIVGAGASLAKINARQNTTGIGDFETTVTPASGVRVGSMFSF